MLVRALVCVTLLVCAYAMSWQLTPPSPLPPPPKAPQFERLNDPQLRENARKMSAIQIAKVHSAAHAIVSLRENGYIPAGAAEAEGGAILSHTPGEVCVLLNCPEV